MTDEELMKMALNDKMTEKQNNKNMFDLPEYRKTSDMEKFIYGFKQLCEQCHIDNVKYYTYTISKYNIPIISSFNFSDGTGIGIVALLEKCGLAIKNY